MTVYEVRIEQAPGTDGRGWRVVRGPCENALEAAKKAQFLMHEGERVVSVRSLYQLDWLEG